jgi:hypothetical protein
MSYLFALLQLLADLGMLFFQLPNRYTLFHCLFLLEQFLQFILMRCIQIIKCLFKGCCNFTNLVSMVILNLLQASFKLFLEAIFKLCCLLCSLLLYLLCSFQYGFFFCFLNCILNYELSISL